MKSEPHLSIVRADNPDEKAARNLRRANVGGSVLRPGDMLGFVGCDLTSALINLGTLSLPFCGLSHVAIVAPDHQTRPKSLVLYESTSLADRPCCIQKKVVRGVQAHPIVERLTEYRGRVYHYPLLRMLKRSEVAELTLRAYGALGTLYDYLGAFRSRDLPLAWLQRRLFGEMELATIFCSEFVAWLWKCLGRGAFANPSAWSPNRLGRYAVDNEITGRPRRLRLPPLRIASCEPS